MTKDAARSPRAASRRSRPRRRTPAYIGVGYIIGPELGALNFAGGVLSWGLFVPLLVFFLGPSHIDRLPRTANGNEAAAWSP